MRTLTTRGLRRGAAVLMATTGAALLVAAPVLAQPEVRTETDLFGFNIEAHASPVSVRFFEGFIPIPTDPGEPQFELTASYTGATLGTGPNGRAVASSIWPGAAFGDGFGTVVGDESQSYPIRAAARYPGRGEEDWTSQTTFEGVEDFGMYARARGLDVLARSEGGGLPAEAAPVVAYGQVRSESRAVVEDGQAVARGTATIGAVRLLEGLVVLEDVTTHLRATSDGTTASTTGGTTVAGVEVLGMPVRLTDQGAVVVPPDEDGDGGDDGASDPLGPVQDQLGPANQALQQLTDDLVADGLEDVLGIRIEALGQDESLEDAVGERTAHGVTITVDLAVLRGYLDPLLDLVPVGDVLDALPDDEDGNVRQLRGLVFELLGLGPEIQFVIGSGFVAAAATPAFELPELPPLPDLPPPGGDGGFAGGTTTSPSAGLDLPPPSASGTTDGPGPSVAPPSSPDVAPPVAAADPIEPFGGVPPAAVGIALLLGAVPTFGMRTVRDAAVGVTATKDVARPLPDLREGA